MSAFHLAEKMLKKKIELQAFLHTPINIFIKSGFKPSGTTEHTATVLHSLPNNLRTLGNAIANIMDLYLILKDV